MICASEIPCKSARPSLRTYALKPCDQFVLVDTHKALDSVPCLRGRTRMADIRPGRLS